MSVNVNELTSRMNAIVAQDPTTPTAGSDDWDLYLKYLNMAQHEWMESYGWPTLYKEVSSITSQSTGNATLSLPSDFRRMDGYLRIADGTVVNDYAQVDLVQRSMYKDNERYFCISGIPGSYSMLINPGTHSSGASIHYSYWSNAGSLISPADISMCPDPNYLVQRAVAYLWEARDDGRFIGAKSESEKILARMLEFEVTRGHSFDDRIRTVEDTKYGFKIGRD